MRQTILAVLLGIAIGAVAFSIPKANAGGSSGEGGGCACNEHQCCCGGNGLGSGTISCHPPF
jgi:hypothetical protein